MTCEICGAEVTKSSDVAIEYVCWKTELGTLEEKTTGKAVHIACLNGSYDAQQMTIQEGLREEVLDAMGSPTRQG